MRLRTLVFSLLVSFFSKAQIITTFAGGGTSGLGDGGQATSAAISDPAGCTFDKFGNFYIVSKVGARIRKIDISGIITTIAGTGVSGFSGDNGAATAAKLNEPEVVICDTLGNLYITDAANNRVREINITTGIITTIAGNGTAAYSGDGHAATAAELNNPLCLCFNKIGELFISDNQNNCIRKINTSGVISTYAGTSIYGFSGDGGEATSAKVWLPWGITLDDTGNLYIADIGNFRIRKVDTSGIITTFAGNGGGTYIGDDLLATNAQFSPAIIQMDTSNSLYIGDNNNYRVYKIDNSEIFHNVAGNGSSTGIEGDGGLATAAVIYYPSGLCFDICGNLYIGDVNNNRVRKVTFNPICNGDSVESLNTNNINTTTSITLFPNPATSTLTITANTKINKITIANLLGQTVYKQEINAETAEVNIGNLPAGVYLAAVIDEEGNKVVKKIVKE